MPTQFDGREERDAEPVDVWFYLWVGLLALGTGLYILVDETAGLAVGITGAAGMLLLALKRGVGPLDWPWM